MRKGRRAHLLRTAVTTAIPAAIFAAVILMAVTALGNNSILGSRHDLSFFNMRGYGTETGPMTGATFNDYRDTCIYCHTPHNGSMEASMWNRQMPGAIIENGNGNGNGHVNGNGQSIGRVMEYQVYDSVHLDSKAVNGPDGISLACLSCHDGTVAVDAVINKPKFHEWSDAGTHYRMNADGSVGSDSCGKCHNRLVGAYGGIGGAHDATIRYLSQDLRDDHPVSMPFPAYDQDPGFNQPMMVKADGGREFLNGVQTFAGDKVQCASCHDPHNPDERNFEGRAPFLRASNRNSALCLTCHQK